MSTTFESDDSIVERLTLVATTIHITMIGIGIILCTYRTAIDGGTVGAENDTNANHGNVYGGGNESKSLDNTTVTLKGSAHIYGNVFGGGNKAEVQGTATVKIEE